MQSLFHISHSIGVNNFAKPRPIQCMGKLLEKCTLTSHSGFSIMDRIKINEQNISIATDPCTYSPKLKRFERSYLADGVSNLITSALYDCEHTVSNYIYT